MFASTRLTIGLLFLGALVEAENIAQAGQQAPQNAESLEDSIKSSKARVVQALGQLTNFQKQLSASYNSTQCRAIAHKIMTDAHASRQAQRERMHSAFDAAAQQAKAKSAQLRQVAGNMAHATNATQASLRQQAHALDTAMGSQINLMASHIASVKKLDREEKRDARHHLNELQSSLRHTAKSHVKEARKAVQDLKKQSKDLEKQQRKAHVSEQKYESTEEKNEQMAEHFQDRIEDMQDDLEDNIENIRDRVQDPLEEERDTLHDTNERAVETLQHHYRAVARMASESRDSMTQATKESQQRLAKAESQHVSLSEETWSNTQAPPLACVVAILIGTMLVFVVDRFRQYRQVSAPDAFGPLA